MTTASDARGVLPKFVQALAVPGQIAKDVALFLSWIARERGKHPSLQPVPVAVAASEDPAAEAVQGSTFLSPIPSSRDGSSAPAPDPPAEDTVPR